MWAALRDGKALCPQFNMGVCVNGDSVQIRGGAALRPQMRRIPCGSNKIQLVACAEDGSRGVTN